MKGGLPRPMGGRSIDVHLVIQAERQVFGQAELIQECR